MTGEIFLGIFLGVILSVFAWMIYRFYITMKDIETQEREAKCARMVRDALIEHAWKYNHEVKK